MKHLTLASRAFGAPLALEPEKARVIADVIGARMRGGHDLPDEFLDDDDAPAQPLLPRVGGVAVIEVFDTLVARGAWIGAQSGLTSYEGLRRQIEAAVADPGVQGIALEIDSPGGEVRGLMDMTAAIRAARAVKPVRAYLMDQATSAAYAIAAQADEVVISRTGWAGHIGTVVVHMELSRMLEQDGVGVTLIQSGARKTDGSDVVPLSDTALAWLQGEVDAARAALAGEIGAGRGTRLDTAAALATEARIYTGADAVSAGLADRVADPLTAFRDWVADITAGAPASAQEATMALRDTGAPADPAPGGTSAAGQGGTCRIGAGEALARVLNESIDRAAGDGGDEARAGVIDRMAEAAGIEPGTVNQILRAEIDCPPIERLRGFAEVLDVSLETMTAAGEEDGCDYSARADADADADGEGEGADAQAERRRIAAILDMPEARGRTELARHFALETGMAPSAARRALAAAPLATGSLDARMRGSDPAPAGRVSGGEGDSVLSDIVTDTFSKGA